MVKRLLAAVLLIILTITATPALADDGLTPPSTSGQPSLVDQYPPDTLQFHNQDASWYEPGKATKNSLTTVIAAVFQFLAMIVKWSLRALEYAWNFNVARWFGGAIDGVASRFSGMVWTFGGLLFTFVGGWIALQVWQGAMSRITGGLVALAMVLGVAVLSQAGLSGMVADVEDASTELAGEILTAGAKGQTVESSIITMTDGVYRQLVLEQWARANFASLEAATKPQYVRNGLPGDVFLGVSESTAYERFKEFDGDKNPDLAPWYSDGSVSRRIGVTLNTLLSIILFLPILLLLSVFVLGAKGLTVMLAMGFPVAVFFAAMPWFSGMRFLRGYTVWVFVAPIVKTLCSFFLAAYMAFLGGLMDASTSIPGGWATVTLIMGSFGLTMWLLGRPLLRLFASLFIRDKVDRQKDRSRDDDRRPAPRWSDRVQPQNRPGGFRQPPFPQGLTLKAARERRQQRLQNAALTYQTVRPPAKASHAGKKIVPEYDLVDLLREAKKVLKAMSNNAANSGTRK